MPYEQLYWSSLPHDNTIGHGREGLVLKLNDTECIKIYTPDRAFCAEYEYKHSLRLYDAGITVPKPLQLVEIIIDQETVKLPDRCEFTGIGLYPYSNLERTPALIKEYIPGTVYGSKKPTWRERRALTRLLNQLHNKGFTLRDHVIKNFVAKPGTGLFGNPTAYLIDCSTLMTRDDYTSRRDSFEEAGKNLREHVLADLKWTVLDLEHALHEL